MSIQQPKKQPDLVRQRILEHAMLLAAQKGVSGVSIQQVALGAGVTKGGVFHHFANKQALLEAMMVELLKQLDAEIEQHIQHDPIQYGCLTRAYLHVTLVSYLEGIASTWSALAMTMVTDSSFHSLWNNWLNAKLQQYQHSDDHGELQLIRLATDGLWLQIVTQALDHESARTLQQRLLQRTYPPIPA